MIESRPEFDKIISFDEFNDQTGFVVEYEMTSDSELVDLTLQLEFLYNNDGYKITSIDVDPR